MDYNNLQNKLKAHGTIFMSFPKSGRTWCRYFIAKYLFHRYHRAFDLDLNEIMLFTHNFFDIHQHDDKLPELLFPEILNSKNVILLVRHPQDVAVSYFYQKHLREELPYASIDEFVLSDSFGIERQSKFVLAELDYFTTKPGKKLLLVYEKIKSNPLEEFSKLLQFILNEQPDKASIDFAIKESSFESMKAYEMSISRENNISDYMGSKAYQDENSLKVRKGVPGSFNYELKDRTIQIISNLPYTKYLIDRLNFITHTQTL